MKKNKFKGKSVKEPFFTSPTRGPSNKVACIPSLKPFKRLMARRARRMPLEALVDGGCYKRLSGAWNLNGDYPKNHILVDPYDHDSHLVHANGKTYFVK
jgi:hypothetical protein